MNVVEPRHGGGTYVTSLEPRLLARPINFLLQVEPRTFLYLFEVRQVLEVAAARLAAPLMTDEVGAELQALVDEAGSAARTTRAVLRARLRAARQDHRVDR